MRYLLDSSAVIAFIFGEPGAERVRELLADDRAPVGLSVLTAAELWNRLSAADADGRFDEVWGTLLALVTKMNAVSLPIVLEAIDLRRAAVARLPYVDALIAATAVHYDAVLVHRDPHFTAIPTQLLAQERLPSS